ncbi:MAG: T9SS type A sorting domain-containing protein [Paludibacter sp.]
MKKLIFLFCFMAGLMNLNAQTLAQSFLFDFGPVTGTNGDEFTAADANGNYWNNISNGTGGNGVPTNTSFSGLKNSANTASSYALTVTVAGFVTNGKANGGLRSPYASQFTTGGSDTDLAIGIATEDFWYTPSTSTPAFKISGLNPNKRYKFKVFGTRNGAVARTAQYSIVGAATTVGTLNNSSLAGLGGTVYTPSTYASDGDNSYKLTSQTGYTTATTYYGNNSSTYVSGLISPLNVSGSGQFTLTLASTVSGQNAFINCMKLEEYKGTQSITFNSLPAKTASDGDFSPGATASSGLTVSYASTNSSVATIVSGQIHIVGAGSTTITASQAGDATYDAASNATQTLTVTTALLTAQTITFDPLSAKTVGDANFDLSATASSNLAVAYNSSNTSVATISGSTVTIVGAGTTDITASQAGDGTYAAASNKIQTLTVTKKTQTITFNSLDAKTDADVPFTISASSTSNLAVGFASSNSNVALISGNTISIVGAGTTIITASQSGDANYSAATSVPQTLTVSSYLAFKQSIFFDFGPKDGTNGDETTGADANGNYWNNISTATGSTTMPLNTPFAGLLNSANLNTGYSLSFTNTGFITNGKLNGGLLSPFTSQFGTNSELVIASATEDYIYTGSTTNGPVITFSGLNPAKKYKFKIFGCRNSNSDRAGQYTLQGAGAATVGTIQSSTATGLGGTVYIDAATSYPTNLNVSYTLTSSGSNTQAVTYYGNNSTVFTSGLIQPDGTGVITLTTITTTPTQAFAYINCMKMEEYSAAQVDASSISVSGSNITASGSTSQLTVLYTPSNATAQTISWMVDDTSIATINSNGLLTPLKNGTVTVTASFLQNGTTISGTKQITITNQINVLYISGTATSNGDNQASALQMNATVGINGSVTSGEYELATTLNASGTVKFYVSQTDVSTAVYGAGASAGTILQGGSAINPGVSGPVLIRVYLASNTYKIYPINPLKISQMGSSVSYGTGATANHGYAYLFSQLLTQRYNSSVGANWTVSNISVPGNSTVDVLNRWDNDLLNDDSKYVVYALSLGNEGIVGGGQAIYDQFKNNMLLLISKAKSVGKIPIVSNCYVRADFSSVEYSFTRQIDLLIHQWDVASINLLGGIDDGTGKWPVSPINYQYDSNHPNDAGHAELMYTIVPSLYDAILAGKAQPTKQGTTYLNLGKSVSTDLLKFTPDNTVHSFTTTFDIKTSTSGVISTFSQSSATGTVRIEPSGVVSYTSPTGATITGITTVTDGQWHKITLTHYYAWGKTMLYTDNSLAGNLTEKLTPTTFVLNDANSPNNISYREWMFYRAGMNADEVSAMNSGKMLKSSLEMYSPLDGLSIISIDPLINLAQSTNKIQRTSIATVNQSFSGSTGISVYPNPAKTNLIVSGLKTSEKYDSIVYGVDGKIALKNSSLTSNQLDISALQPGFYFLSINNNKTHENFNLNFIKI